MSQSVGQSPRVNPLTEKLLSAAPAPEVPLSRRFSSFGVNHDEHHTDRFAELVHAALRFMVQEAAPGIVAAEIWVLDRGGSMPILRRMRSGWFIDPAFECRDAAALNSLFADAEDQHFTPTTSPGVSLAGVLFEGNTEWRPLGQMATNPELPSCHRTTAAATCFGCAAGAQFQVSGCRGVVVLYSRETADVSTQGLAAPTNVSFLNSCAHTAGSLAVASRANGQLRQALELTPASQATASRYKMLRALTKTGLISAAARESSRASARHDDEGRARHAAMQLQRWVKKIGGTQTAALAPASWGQATFAFFGAALTALVVVAVNAEVTEVTKDPRNTILSGGLGALMTMQYAAFNSPLAQPRNVIGASLIAAATALTFTTLSAWIAATFAADGDAGADVSPDGVLLVQPPWVFVFAPATAIALMHKAGLTHPPAGAVTMLMITTPASATWRWVLTPLLAGNVLCILVAIAVNNVSSKRQYPIYW